MSDEKDGLAIALERIGREAEERTGTLELGTLGLHGLPEPLFQLTHLRQLNLASRMWDSDEFRPWIGANLALINFVASLDRLHALSNLQALSVNGCKIESLRGIDAIKTLRFLDCGSTEITDLAPLKGLTALQTLSCSGTQVSDLTPLKGLTALQALDCGGTEVSDLTPLTGLTALRELDCALTQITDLTPLKGLTALQVLGCSLCSLADFPSALLNTPSLKTLLLYNTHIPGVPTAALSQNPGDNCLESFRAHVRDLEAGGAPLRDVKLMVLGNGRVGKTQLCRRLRGEGYDPDEPSTHGIMVRPADLPAADARLRIWDFGGQDIYHGTHALFLRTSAVFLLAWTPELEDARDYEHDGILYRDHPLAYWVAYVRHGGGANSPVLVVQTQCDLPEDDTTCPVPEQELRQTFPFLKILQHSARTPRGLASLSETLAEAVRWLRDREGVAAIGAGRLRVQRRLEAWQDTDAALPPEERRHRTISQDQFHQLCREAGGVSSPGHLLAYLHNAGIVFYRPGLFHDAIILDQGWALDAIYDVFHREKCFKRIRRQQGRFTRGDLEDWVWGELDHGVEEQELFLSMMQSCGICFAHRRLGAGGEDETEYMAPDLLPERAGIELDLAQKWDSALPTEVATFDYALLHRGLMRSVIAHIGEQAGLAADYWKGGVYVYETETGSRALIEEATGDDWRGSIRIQTQRGETAELLKRLIALVEAEQTKAGMTPVTFTSTDAGRRAARNDVPSSPEALALGQEPSPQLEWYVSYAWRDDTEEGREREAIVDRLCAASEARGVRILRDKDVMSFGDRISRFMQRIGRGDRVFIVLSDKYLKSPFCMYELYEVWRIAWQDKEKFLSRIRVYTLPCAKIWNPMDQVRYAVYWKERYAELKAVELEHGEEVLGRTGLMDLWRMRQYSGHVKDILAAVAGVLQPRTFEDLVTYGFDADRS